jgi:hypothetical protein
MRIVMDLECRRFESFGDLFYWSITSTVYSRRGEGNTFARMTSSIGVCEAIVESGRLAKDNNDLRSI